MHFHLFNNPQNNVTSEQMDFDITALRLDPAYIFYYVHWTRFILTLAIPFVFLVSVNTAIYVRIRQNLTSLVVIHQDSCRY